MNVPNGSHVVGYDSLDVGDQLGRGGQGTVYRVANKKINNTDGPGWDVVFKEYNTASLAQLDIVALTKMVALLSELSRSDGEWLCDKTAWPAAMVARQEHVCGIIMRVVPDRFRFTLRGLSATTGTSQRLANLEYLLNDDSYVARIGLHISERDRLEILADLAATLARLHRFGIVVGDLSPKNLLFTTDPAPECFLIDCDAMRVRGESVLPQAETPDWTLPSGEEKATQAGDVYKFGLLAVRLFARDQTTTDTTPLTAIHPALGTLAQLSLDPGPARRPLPAHWAEHLRSAAAIASTAPATAPPATVPSPAQAPQPATSNAHPTGAKHAPNRLNPALAAIAAGVIVGIIVVLGVATQLPDNGSSRTLPPVPSVKISPPRASTPYIPSPPPVPPAHYVAGAYGTDDNRVYWATDSSQHGAVDSVMGRCGSDCKPIWAKNRCIAIAFFGNGGWFWGDGFNVEQAQNDAASNARNKYGWTGSFEFRSQCAD
ncbi:hypothetical protein OIE68_09165 [Nocardia vinacea]|uniref:DUF4189 domain-containing protein n=1 Tax=Nocardia vinacea TaxID=96468 RepID=UPI002E0D69B0|nr:hypothetical protein OIE68_09165 [Nocardia vinacea]